MEIGVETDASQFTAFVDRVSANLSMANDHILRGFENAQATYLGDMRDQFQRNSRGGGLWPDLAPSTKLKRFYEAGGRFKRTKGVTRADRLRDVAKIPFPILYITGAIYTSLFPGETDNIFQHSEDSVSAGTQAFQANYHNSGAARSRLPRRQILHEPTDQLLAAMAQPIVAGFRTMIEEATGVLLSQ